MLENNKNHSEYGLEKHDLNEIYRNLHTALLYEQAIIRQEFPHSRAMVKAALNGELNDTPTWTDPIFGINLPESRPNVPADTLRPRDIWHS